jgi:hypothetical protein
MVVAMNPKRWEQIDGVFREAVRLGAEERRGYLEKVCRGDAELRGEVDALLAGARNGAGDNGVVRERTRLAAPIKTAIDPVVGWLVCMKGPNLGSDYRIRAARNRIGRDSVMDICLSGDNRVARDTHAMIVYDPRYNDFRLSLGPACEIVFLNGEFLDGSAALRERDVIELGETGLQFVPFCGNRFQWK